MTPFDQIVALEADATAAEAAGEVDRAVRAHLGAISRAEPLGRPGLVAVLYYRTGRVLEKDGQLQAALGAYENGLRALRGSDPDVDAVVRELRSVGKGFQWEAQPLPDLYTDEIARDLARAENDPALLTALMVQAGNMYLRQPQPGPAAALYEQALARQDLGDPTPRRAAVLANYGEALRRLDRPGDARDALTEALALFDASERPPERRRALVLLAGLERDAGEPERAASLYDEAIALYEGSSDNLGEAHAHAGRGQLELACGRTDAAGSAFSRALDLAAGAPDPTSFWHAHWGLGRVRLLKGDAATAVAPLEEAARLVERRQGVLRTDEGKVSFLEGARDLYDDLVLAHLGRARDRGDFGAALGAAERSRARALRDLLDARRWRPPLEGPPEEPLLPFDGPGIANLPMDDSPVQMAPGIELRPEPLDPPPWVQMAPGIELPPVADDVPAEPAEPLPDPDPLPRLVFHVLEKETALFLVTATGETHGAVAPVGEATLAERVGALRAALRVAGAARGVEITRFAFAVPEEISDAPPLETQLRELYDLLVAPLAAWLPADDELLVIEPDGPLWLLPLAALQDADGRYLGDRYPLLLAPSATVLDEIRREPDYGDPEALEALIVGNPTMPAPTTRDGLEIALKPLPGAEREARAIAKRLGDRAMLLVGDAATRAAVEAEAPRRGLLHLATHGIAYSDDPLASFVALADGPERRGILTARELASWRLPADLVTLSACQSGLGRVSGDGMLGLGRVLLLTGARSLLVSLWSVDDRATAALMEAFYEHYLADGDKARALQRAMRALREKPRTANPRYWASFVLIGAES